MAIPMRLNLVLCEDGVDVVVIVEVHRTGHTVTRLHTVGAGFGFTNDDGLTHHATGKYAQFSDAKKLGRW